MDLYLPEVRSILVKHLVFPAPYIIVVVCRNSIFRHGSSHMDHHTIFYIRVGLAPIIVTQYNMCVH